MRLLGTKFLMNDYNHQLLQLFTARARQLQRQHRFACGTLCPTPAFTRASLKEINKNLIVKYFGTATVSF